MSYLIKVNQVTQIQVKKDGQTSTKPLLPNTKYVVDDLKNKQIADLKFVKCLIAKQATPKDESFFEHLELA